MPSSYFVISKILERRGLTTDILPVNKSCIQIVIVEARFDVIKKLQAIYPDTRFPVLKIKDAKTREVLYQILQGIRGSAKNPRKIYGTDLKTITAYIKNLFLVGILILSYDIHPKAIERIIFLEIPVFIIIQPTKNKKELRDLSSKYPKYFKSIKIKDDVGALEHYARFILPSLADCRLNPWSPLTPHQMAELLELSERNVLLFSYMLNNINLPFEDLIKFAYKEYIRNELEPFEIEILAKIESNQNKILEIDLIRNFSAISKTKIQGTLRKLTMLNLIRKIYDYSSKKTYYELNSKISGIGIYAI